MINEEACHIMAILGFIFPLFLWLTWHAALQMCTDTKRGLMP